MKKVLSLVAVAGMVAAFAAPAKADEFVARYTYLVNGAQVPAAGIAAPTLTQPAIVGAGCGTVLTQPAVIDNCATQAAVARPIMVEDHENIVPHFFHLGLWPLVDFSIF